MKIFIPEKNSFAEFEIIENGDVLTISNSKKTHNIDLKPLGKNLYSLLIDNHSYTIEATKSKGEVRIVFDQHEYTVPVMNSRERIESEILGSSASADEKGEIRSPMPGLILKIEVEKGDAVQSGQPLLIMEAMKMENEIRAQFNGEVKEILIKENQKVEKGDLLIRIG
jgi:biotin carboxyl carrier protein